MPIFASVDLSADFKNAIKKAYASKKWIDVFEVFGTHVVTSTILGGRMHLIHEIKSENYQSMISRGVDVKGAASAEYFSFSGRVEAGLSVDDTDKSEFNSKVENRKEIFLGGKPPLTGNWIDWYGHVLNGPVPIKISIRWLTDLFTVDNFKGLSQANIDNMTIDFNIALKAYCRQVGCIIPEPDSNLKSSYTLELELSKDLAGFKYLLSLPGLFVIEVFSDTEFLKSAINPEFRLKKIFIRCGRVIDGLRFLIGDSKTQILTPFHGNQSGIEKIFELSENEVITQIETTYDEHVDSLRFITNKRISEKYGEGILNLKQHAIKGALLGLYGSTQTYVKGLGFITGSLKLIDQRERKCFALWKYFDGSCYFKIEVNNTFAEAHKYCQSKDASLLILNSNDELEFIKTRIIGSGNSWVFFLNFFKLKKRKLQIL